MIPACSVREVSQQNLSSNSNKIMAKHAIRTRLLMNLPSMDLILNAEAEAEDHPLEATGIKAHLEV